MAHKDDRLGVRLTKRSRRLLERMARETESTITDLVTQGIDLRWEAHLANKARLRAAELAAADIPRAA